MRLLLLLFIGMPILEMFVLIKVGGIIGVVPTIAMVVLTAMVGLALLRRQGMSTLLHAQQKLDSGELPLTEVVEGIFLAVGGALLLTPGFITDFIGFCCLIPGLRHWLITKGIVAFKPNVVMFTQGQRAPSPTDDGRVIQGEYRREDD